MASEWAKSLVVELCRQFYSLGWISGTGGGISIREGQQIVVAPSGVQKERLHEEDLFVLDRSGAIIEQPRTKSRLSECAPLFLSAYRLRDAGAVIHSHSLNAVLATLLFGDIFEITHSEMLKGLRGHGYADRLLVPIIENTPREADLVDSMAQALSDYPKADAVLVRRHGVYVWGSDWMQAKTQAECYDYLFALAVQMKELGFDPAQAPH